jgi:hypothetical protein
MRIITSPGVQITEKDLSLKANMPAGTSVLVTGFANQGPVNEPIMITSATEFENVYGTPTTPAERYFYYTCKEVLNSPGVLTTLRLPYGAGDGSSVAANVHTALFYPMASALRPSYDGTGDLVEWVIGKPVAMNLSDDVYELAQKGNIQWGELNEGGFATEVLGSYNAGFVVLNDAHAVVNEMSEGYYFGLCDNLAVLSSDSPDFDSIRKTWTLNDDTGSLFELPETRLDFHLSATKEDSDNGITSVSESLEKVGFVGYETPEFHDHISLGLFKIRRSTVDPTLLTLGTTERYIGSFDLNRRVANQSGGMPQSAYLEDIINTTSPAFKIFVNPKIANDYVWSDARLTAPTARITVADDAKALFPVGTFAPNTRAADSAKEVGSVPGKLDRALRTLEAIDDVTVDVVTDGGLSTIFASTETFGYASFDDEKYISDPKAPALLQNWTSVANILVNFSQNIRKDCMTILDPLRQTFVNGRDSKTIDLKSKTFTDDIYSPLRKQASIESNYTALYANWIKISDLFTGRKLWVPFSGYAAAIYARTDAIENPWAAPAGMTRGTFLCLDVALNPNQKQRDRLYEIGTNPVVFFNGDGYVVMGQKTLQKKPSAFDRINVRRLFLFLERAVQRTVKYFVFEPNTDLTRARLKAVIDPIFAYAKYSEGLYDYLIVVDSRNNTPDTIDQNELIVDIYIKPVRTAEFILVNFIATRTGQNFTELV